MPVKEQRSVRENKKVCVKKVKNTCVETTFNPWKKPKIGQKWLSRLVLIFTGKKNTDCVCRRSSWTTKTNTLHTRTRTVFFFFPVKIKIARESHFWPFFRFFSRVKSRFHACIFHFFHAHFFVFTDTFLLFHWHFFGFCPFSRTLFFFWRARFFLSTGTFVIFFLGWGEKKHGEKNTGVGIGSFLSVISDRRIIIWFGDRVKDSIFSQFSVPDSIFAELRFDSD